MTIEPQKHALSNDQIVNLVALGVEKAEVKVELTKDEIKDLVREGVLQAFDRVGMGGAAEEVQRDMAHLRRWRTSVDAASSTTVKTIVTVLIAGLLGALWLGITTLIENPPPK